MRIAKLSWESASDYSKRVSATCIPTGGRRVKVAKSAVFKKHIPKANSLPVREFKGKNLEEYLRNHPVAGLSSSMVIK